MVPLPAELTDLVYPAFRKQAAEDKLDERPQLPDSPHSPYLRVTIPSHPALIFIPKPVNKLDHEMSFDGFNKHRKEAFFNLQMPRMVIAELIGLPERWDWRNCVVSEEEETQETEKLRAIYSFE
jgi:hypothetical protein